MVFEYGKKKVVSSKELTTFLDVAISINGLF